MFKDIIHNIKNFNMLYDDYTKNYPIIFNMNYKKYKEYFFKSLFKEFKVNK